ncbi:MAG: cobalt-precorrin-5B (C(1))-methyltransferase CbiD [Desulfuromonadaceae bacterium]|nr:cobalt-precorrin-5B (C(1))-methyltransferase CbiD [Desulfuromonadaceae bacterium]MDD2855248.1 cobalt-precorrin-5B (C(1))-methyltransferase CbiD [Desulfuromonadaceae bacterium]
MKKHLRSGYTTGACAAAAAKGAALMLASQRSVSETTIELPTGAATFKIDGQTFSDAAAACFVVKDAGDDPDVTNGVEVHARVTRTVSYSADAAKVFIAGGSGVGKVTKPGLAVAVGDWAINPVPRRMIGDSVGDVIREFNIQNSILNVEIYIPDGEDRAKKTLNARLGIVGGLSILGTTGIVRAVSAKAWTDTIDAAVDVAKACNSENVVLSTGRSSEKAVQGCLQHLPEEAYVMMGDHVAYALRACAERGFMQPVVACQFAKMLKIACGYENTHAVASELDLEILYRWGVAAGFSAENLSIISGANTAREIAVTSRFNRELVSLVALKAAAAAAKHAPGIEIAPLLCGYDGSVVPTE